MNDQSFSRLYIFGAGGHGREIAWLARSIWADTIEIVHLVDQEKYLHESVNGNRVALLADICPEKTDRFVAAIGDGTERKRVVAACVARGLIAVSLVHPRVEISQFVSVGAGSVICAGCVITTNISLGEHVHINIGSTISHDVAIGDFSTISPGVHVAGNVKIGQMAFIGTGATIINGSATKPLSIGEDAIIAAAACVIDSVAPACLMAGVPAVKKS